MKVQQLTVAAEQLLAGLTSKKCKFKLTWAVIIYILALTVHCRVLLHESSLLVSDGI